MACHHWSSSCDRVVEDVVQLFMLIDSHSNLLQNFAWAVTTVYSNFLFEPFCCVAETTFNNASKPSFLVSLTMIKLKKIFAKVQKPELNYTFLNRITLSVLLWPTKKDKHEWFLSIYRCCVNFRPHAKMFFSPLMYGRFVWA